ncbi:aminoglycoside phosphotransferase family protein [Paenibacillaceae bacterium]|nr:aminoglycoside phosphotransferase family protein [Paenibacillaceae bacterium]
MRGERVRFPNTERGNTLKRSAAPKIEFVKQLADEFFGKSVEVERVTKGGSTYVFRIIEGNQTYYLRVLPEPNASFAVEVHVHELLIKKGVNVPTILCFEHKNNLMELSIMIAKEIVGNDLEAGSMMLNGTIEQVLFEAGKQIALVNQVAVEGFGELNRAIHDTLVGEFKTFHHYYNENLENDLFLLSKYNLDEQEKKAAQHFLEIGFDWMDNKTSHLVHGDFDLSHIFHNHGTYTGIIDFGDIKGSSPFYDLGHYKTHDSIKGFESLVRGYKDIRDLSPKDDLEISLWALFIAVRRLGMIHNRPRNFYHDHLTNTLKNLVVELNQKI